MKNGNTNVMDERAAAPATAPRAQSNEGVINLPDGLLGLGKHNRYLLLGSAAEKPFLWLHSVDDPSLEFVVVEPEVVVKNYQPDLRDEDVQSLDLKDAGDALLLNIVSVHADGHATVNLKGPIVLNRRTLVGRQVIPQNAGAYSLQHPIRATAA